MKIALLGCKNTTLEFLSTFLEDSAAFISQVISLPIVLAQKNQVANYAAKKIEEFCKEREIPFYYSKSYNLQNEEDINFFQKNSFDLVLVIGWERLLPQEILASVNYFACGMHGSAFGLPRGRGRSPLNWALITGQKKFTTYLFRYTPGIDDGDIIGKHSFDITLFDDIETLHLKNRLSMGFLVQQMLDQLKLGKVEFTSQSTEKITFYPKRNPEDGAIDWNRSTEEIYNLIRATCPPYPAAYSYWGEHKISIYRATPFDDKIFVTQSIPGTLLEICQASKKLIVQTGNGSMILHDYSIPNTARLKKGQVFTSVPFEQTLKKIISRYPIHLPEEQREINLDLL